MDIYNIFAKVLKCGGGDLCMLENMDTDVAGLIERYVETQHCIPTLDQIIMMVFDNAVASEFNPDAIKDFDLSGSCQNTKISIFNNIPDYVLKHRESLENIEAEVGLSFGIDYDNYEPVYDTKYETEMRKLGFNVVAEESELFFNILTPLGENFSFSVSYTEDEKADGKSIIAFCKSFDKDSHAREMVNSQWEVTVAQIVDDSQWIWEQLDKVREILTVKYE